MLLPPGVVDEQLGIDPEEGIEHFLIAQGHAGDIPHGEHVVGIEPAGGAGGHHPEVRDRHMRPEQAAVALFVELGNAHPVPVRRGFFGDNVHGHLGQVKIGPNADRGRDAGGFQDIADERHGQIVRGAVIEVQVGCGVDKALIDGIDVDVLLGNIAQIDTVDFGRCVQIELHARRGNDVFDVRAAARLGLPDGAPGRHADGLEGGGYGQTDGLVGAAFIGDEQTGPERVQTACHAFHGGVIGFQVDADIHVRHADTSLLVRSG